MSSKRLNLNLLFALDALLTERSVTTAAEKLFVTQSAMSGSLARLRDYFDDELLVRKGHDMLLTPRAESLRQPIQEALRQVKIALETKPEFNPAESVRHFTVMCSDYITSVLLSPAVRHFANVAPGVKLDIVPITGRPQEALEHGEIDILITLDNYADASHPSELLFEETESCVAWAGNPLLDGPITLQQFQELGHVVVRFGTSRHPAIEEWLLKQAGDITRNIEIVAPSFSMVPFLLMETNRIATMHTRLARTMARLLPLRIMPMPIEIPPIRQVIQWHRNSSQDLGVMWLQQMLREIAHETLASDGSPGSLG